MTFQEASSLVSNMSLNPYYYNNELYTAIVVPEIINDRIKFIADLKEGKVTVNGSFVKYILRAKIAGLTIINIIKLLIAKFITLFEVV